jgi:hypothetical protein
MSTATKGNSEGEMLGMHPACSTNMYRRSTKRGNGLWRLRDAGDCGSEPCTIISGGTESRLAQGYTKIPKLQLTDDNSQCWHAQHKNKFTN